MKTITRLELRKRMSQVLRAVESGEHMEIAVNGRPVAELVPVAKVGGHSCPGKKL